MYREDKEYEQKQMDRSSDNLFNYRKYICAYSTDQSKRDRFE